MLLPTLTHLQCFLALIWLPYHLAPTGVGNGVKITICGPYKRWQAFDCTNETVQANVNIFVHTTRLTSGTIV